MRAMSSFWPAFSRPDPPLAPMLGSGIPAAIPCLEVEKSGGRYMTSHRVALTILMVAGVAAPVSAGIIFNRKPKVSPNERVVQLVAVVKTEADDRKRAAAAKELRDFDPTKFPEVVTVLLDCAL